MSGGTRVLVACMPKSGSTYFSGAIAALPGFHRAHLVPGYGHREQELCVEKLREHDRIAGPEGSYVAQHHVRCSDVTRAYLEQFGIRTIVLVRNIFDVVPSLVDHHRLEGTVYPAAHAPPDIASRSFEEQARFVVQMALPWYVSFYVSWASCPGVKVVAYEEWIAEPVAVLRACCGYLGLDTTTEISAAAVHAASSAGVRRNKVVPGRGRDLPEDCLKAIHNMRAHYPAIDFSRIGIA